MKRGKDDEKMIGPMFPRLHVNDTEKGGPRAPPRNKMALYEQFSIPSQRFNQTVLPLNPDNSTNTAPPASLSQGTVPERNCVFPVHLPPQTPIHPGEKYISRQSDGENLNASLVQPEQRKKVDEDDFRVPVYIHSRIDQSNDESLESFNGKKITATGSRYFGCSVAGQNDSGRDPKQFGSPLVNMRKDVRSETDGLPQVSLSKEQLLMPERNMTTGEKINTLVKQAKVTRNQEFQEFPVSKISRLRQGDACLQRDCRAGSQLNDIGHGNGVVESPKETDKGNAPIANQTSPAEAINDTEYHNTRTGSPIQRGKLNKSDNVSKISWVENLSTLKISPDDVVEVIGQKHFWKARRAIANQQRVFAVQVFELHRLIKVQQLIAGSPDLLHEDGAFLGKSPPKGSIPKKLSLEYVVKPRQQNLKCKDDSEKLNHKMECSAENAVGKTSLSSVKNGSHLSNHTHFAGNPHQANMAADSGMGPWSFHQSPGHQWLIPVMTPSEGLVYKPYPGPGFTGTICGGCGPFGPAPLGGTFMNPTYGIPASHQGIGVPPDTPPGSHAYFPPYGMPAMNAAMSESAVEQVNQFSAPGSRGQNDYLSGGEANPRTKKQRSCNLPLQRKEAIPHVKYQTSKEFELQGSTASSPSEMAQAINTSQIAEGRDVLPFFPMVPVEPEGVPQSLETGQQTRVIKVVPHNRRFANESAARIFQSIQEERKQYDD
ncbi:protein EARLY FLOWERING 3-like [Gastrolobium bilobum]|uniref:protein EARLY FLOWERING 3-like n=1 Tax=Gastrolobium bilobum TaxID=150636 RepID=UPI002AAFA0B5|nr:protein EARLY FLOWERING 3-like [Gastrolobium bilobum]XP_061374896.1 protein EARLY FLOWERING 3-like [Gastrolobium bilobum]